MSPKIDFVQIKKYFAGLYDYPQFQTPTRPAGSFLHDIFVCSGTQIGHLTNHAVSTKFIGYRTDKAAHHSLTALNVFIAESLEIIN